MTHEQLTTNPTQTQLAQIDYLVERGLYENREEFARLAFRKLLDEHKGDFDKFLDRTNDVQRKAQTSWVWSLGVHNLTKKYVDDIVQSGGKLSVRVIGVLIIDDAIDADALASVLINCKVVGKIVTANEDIKARIAATFGGNKLQ